MTSYFWSGFPSLSGRSDVMYGRRHIGGTDPPALHVTPIGSDSYAIVPPIILLSYVTSSFRTFWPRWKRAINESILYARSSCPKRQSMVGRHSRIERKNRHFVLRADEIEISFRLDGDTQLCINPGYGLAYACTANWPGQAARRGYISIIRGNYYERPSSSILIFCSRPLRPPPRRGKD